MWWVLEFRFESVKWKSSSAKSRHWYGDMPPSEMRSRTIGVAIRNDARTISGDFETDVSDSLQINSINAHIIQEIVCAIHVEAHEQYIIY